MRIAIWAVVAWLGLNLLLLTLWFAYGRVLWRRRRTRSRPARARPHDSPSLPPVPAEPEGAQVLKRAPDLRAQLLDALIAALQDPYPPTRREAVRALKGIGDYRAIPALEDAEANDTSVEVQEEAREAVALLKRRRSREQTGEAG